MLSNNSSIVVLSLLNLTCFSRCFLSNFFFVFWVASLKHSLNPLQVAETDANSRKQMQESARIRKKMQENVRENSQSSKAKCVVFPADLFFVC